MFIEEIQYIADVEMMRLGCLTRPIQHEIINAARRGRVFTQVVSKDDADYISAEMSRLNCRQRMTKKKVGTDRIELSFNKSE